MKPSTKEDLLDLLYEIGIGVRNLIFYILFPIVLFAIIMVTMSFCDPNHENTESSYNDNYNAYMQEQAEDYEEREQGEREANSYPCEAAKDFPGENIMVKGSVESIFQSKESSGKPTFIDLDYEYPNPNRVTVIIWEEDLNNLEGILSHLEYGDIIYVKGMVEIYDGVAQIEVSDPDQIEVE